MATKQKKQWGFSIGYIVFVVVLLLLVQQFVVPLAGPQQAPYSQFVQALDEGNIAEAQIDDTEIIWKTKDEGKLMITTRLPGVDDREVILQLLESGAVVTGNMPSKLWTVVASLVLPIIFFALLWYLLIGRVGGHQQYLSFGRSKARVYNRGSVNVTFDSVAGVDEAKAELQEIVDFLKNPKKYQALGGRIPKGVLLVGPPGTGKTLLAKATAGEAGVPFFSMSGSEFVEMFVGVGAARVRDLFEQAKKNAPCIVFIDEIDTIGKQRGGAVALRHDEQEQTLNQLLTEMDGFDSSQGVIIMAATNRPDVLDPALLRPGRFDRQIVVDKPDMKGREEILKVHARGVKLAPDVDLHTIAARTPGFAGAELANVINEAALLAARRGKSAVEMADLEEAVDRVMTGLERRSRALSEQEKKTVAYHEMGHALVGLLLPHADPVHRVSIIPRGMAALGMTLQLPLQDRYLFTKEELEDKIAVLLGGRAAEEIALGRISTGAQNDLYQATQLARRMVREFGMSDKLGPLTFSDGSSPFLPSNELGLKAREYSEETARAIDSEVRDIIERNYQRAKNLLKENEDILNEFAQELEQKETMQGSELRGKLANRIRAELNIGEVKKS
jgi:cell division protease FtsH